MSKMKGFVQKHWLTLSIFSALLFSIAAYTYTLKGKDDIINVEKDISYLSGNTVANAAGDGVTDDAASINWAFNYASQHKKEVYFPAADSFLVKSQLSLHSNLVISTSGIGACIKVDASFPANTPVLLGIGDSCLTIDGLHITNLQKSFVSNFIQLNSDPYKVKHIRLLNLVATDSWVGNVVKFGSAGNTAIYDCSDDVTIEGCYIARLNKPGVLIIHDNNLYFTDNFCSGIHLGQTTFGVYIRKCRFERLSGDAIFQFGSSPGTQYANTPYYMNTTVEDCDFDRVNMGVELNGGNGGYGADIHNCRFKWPRIFAISVSCRNSRFENNDFLTAGAGFIETTSTNGIISGNTGKMISWRNDSTGYELDPPVVGSSRTHFLELGGYNYLVDGNNFVADRSNPTRYTPAEYDGISINGKNREQNPTDQDWYYNNVYDYCAFYDIKDNTLVGVTNRVLDVTITKARCINFCNNTVISSALKETPFHIWGYNYRFLFNIIDVTGSPYLATSHDWMDVFYVQAAATDSSKQTKSMVQYNYLTPVNLTFAHSTLYNQGTVNPPNALVPQGSPY